MQENKRVHFISVHSVYYITTVPFTRDSSRRQLRRDVVFGHLCSWRRNFVGLLLCNDVTIFVNPLMSTDNHSATSNNMKLVHWPLMCGLLHLVQRVGNWAEPQPAHAPPRCTECNSQPVNGQCTSHRIAV